MSSVPISALMCCMIFSFCKFNSAFSGADFTKIDSLPVVESNFTFGILTYRLANHGMVNLLKADD
jgi:hypothetical protein